MRIPVILFLALFSTSVFAHPVQTFTSELSSEDGSPWKRSPVNPTEEQRRTEQGAHLWRASGLANDFVQTHKKNFGQARTARHAARLVMHGAQKDHTQSAKTVQDERTRLGRKTPGSQAFKRSSNRLKEAHNKHTTNQHALMTATSDYQKTQETYDEAEKDYTAAKLIKSAVDEKIQTHVDNSQRPPPYE
ncbi:hypothetical protein DACRYDRAFT_102576 [Dacryopinax primogenitus]|uniref:Uncharacterized protein n=1 Tax=Dacryopinax primogenitus (strain DJM 731) TaxID=1858805 RepID=M5FV76_DACPD|nr:uncharacterized protein DACRYDRAFT_102576 [Dacryopinax primogenitus]EJT97196.1 hypothetical protein DACRYDRAFT_102576 [Dacryopinax primogenitus]